MTKATCYITAMLFVLSLPVTAQATIVYSMATDATAFWDFNGSNPLVDKTGNGHTLVNPGGGNSPSFPTSATASSNGWMPNELTAAFIDGNTSGVASFDGNDYLAIPNSAYSGGDFTIILAQLRPDAAAGFDTLHASSRYRFQNINDTLSGGINAPSGSFGGSSPLNPDDWYYVALTYNDTTRALASYAATNTGTLGAPVLVGSANAPGLGDAINFRLGGDGTSGIGSLDGWAGELDFAIFHVGLLTQEQLQLAFDDFVLGPQMVPEPSSFLLLGLGVLGLMRHARRRRQRA
jgi:hypothetical protein